MVEQFKKYKENSIFELKFDKYFYQIVLGIWISDGCSFLKAIKIYF